MAKSFTPKFSINNKTFSPSDKPPGPTSSDYEELTHKPQINGVTLIGNKTTEDLGLEEKDPTVPQYVKDGKALNEEDTIGLVKMKELWDSVFK